jgi:hypothetical protein
MLIFQGAGLLGLALSTGAQGTSPLPPTVTVDQAGDGTVVFRFLDTPRVGRPVPIGANSLSVYRKGQHHHLLWHIIGDTGALLDEITYGVLPRGFRQHAPAVGEPPALEQGAEYCVESHDSACFRYRSLPR